MATTCYHDSNLQKETHLQYDYIDYMFFEQQVTLQCQISRCCFRFCNTNLFTAHHLGNSHCQVRDVRSITHQLIIGFTRASRLRHMHHSLLNLSRRQSNVPTKLLVNATLASKQFGLRSITTVVCNCTDMRWFKRNVNGIGTTTENARCLDALRLKPLCCT